MQHPDLIEKRRALFAAKVRELLPPGEGAGDGLRARGGGAPDGAGGA